MTMHYIYWVSTLLLVLLYLASAALYILKSDFVRKTQADMGYSAGHLLPFMVVIKILGPLAILSRFNVGLSDLAYAGMLYHLILSTMAHFGVRKPLGAIPALVGLLLLSVSFTTQNAVRDTPSPYVVITSLAQH
ncbi:DoxX family protein [Methylobacillus gramineus]|uniref:DoxX family protein n=1 Tax=Methylobacillus gramineus TaxID=755169 RepID=UPI001CFFC64B|nr:DoxX family protein [Methylobacillus gramineus]MCB5183955.1 DoxX family protein [Methylobacillus gramineus]